MVLTGANLSFANATEANFSYSHADGADFNHAILPGVRFSRANARGADFSGAALQMAHLPFADLRVAHFGGMMTGAVLEDANLSGAFLQGVIIQGVTLSSTDLTGATVEIPDFYLNDYETRPFFIDVSLLKFTVLDSSLANELKNLAIMTVSRSAVHNILKNIDEAVGKSSVLPFDYCLYASPISKFVACKHRFSQDTTKERDAFALAIAPTFERMVCYDRATARNFSYRVRSRVLAHEARSWFLSPKCRGATELTADEKNEELGVLEQADPLEGTGRPRVDTGVYISKLSDWYP